MMIFDMDCANFILKLGVNAIGAGIHKKTHKAYVYFDKNDPKFQSAINQWNEEGKLKK